MYLPFIFGLSAGLWRLPPACAPTDPIEQEHSEEWGDEDNKRLQDVLLEESLDMASENGTAFSRFGETVSLTFLESSVLSSVLCVGFAEILVCFQL